MRNCAASTVWIRQLPESLTSDGFFLPLMGLKGPMIREYLIDAEKKQQFAGIVTLNYIYENDGGLALPLAGNDMLLEPTLAWAESRGHVSRGEAKGFELTESGLLAVKVYRAQFREFLRTFEIYAFVDLEEAEFAYEKFFEFETEEQWDDHIEGDNWSDLRIAVAEFKEIDPLVIVFMSFVNEGLFDDEANWQSDLHDEGLWTEVQELCNCSVAIEDLAYEDPDDGRVEGAEVLEDIIREGAEMNLELKILEDELSSDEPVGDRNDDEEEILDIEAYYTPYIEPSFVAPVWMMSWAL